MSSAAILFTVLVVAVGVLAAMSYASRRAKAQQRVDPDAAAAAKPVSRTILDIFAARLDRKNADDEVSATDASPSKNSHA